MALHRCRQRRDIGVPEQGRLPRMRRRGEQRLHPSALVVGGIVAVEREGLDRCRVRVRARDEPEQQRRIEPARQADPDRDVRPEAETHRVLEQREQLAGDLVFATLVRPQRAHALRRVVPSRLPQAVGRAPAQQRSRRKPPNPAPERRLAVVVHAVREIGRPGRRVRLARHAGGVQRLDLARDQERAIGRHGVVQRLHAEAIAGGEQRPGPLVPEREREHPDEPIETRLAPALVGGEQHLGVAAGPEGIAGELLSELAVVVDLPVEDEPRGPVGAGHRLRSGVGEIDDGETQVPQPDAVPQNDRLAIRTAVALRVEHRLQPRLMTAGASRDHGNATHDQPRPVIMSSTSFMSSSLSTPTDRSGGMTIGRITSPQIEPRSISTSRRVR